MLRWFPDLTLADRPQVGGKGASLGELAHAGIPVPPGFVITSSAFEQFLAGRGVRRRINSIDRNDDEAIAETGAEIRSELRELEMPAEICDSFCDAYRQLQKRDGASSVAIRSSATCEDSKEASFAGLQDTYLWINGEQQLIEQVRACWASLYNTESIAYRLRLDLDETQLAMAVVVQQMVDAECAGVMFTRSPTTGDRSVIVIEGSWGLGSCLVSGEVTPDRFVINKVTGDFNVRDISTKLIQHVRHSDGDGVAEIPVDPSQQDVTCLSDDDLLTLWKIARQVETHYGCPQDIEWAIPRKPAESGHRVLLLQSRPETIWSNRQKEPAAVPMPKAFDHVLSVMGGKKK